MASVQTREGITGKSFFELVDFFELAGFLELFVVFELVVFDLVLGVDVEEVDDELEELDCDETDDDEFDLDLAISLLLVLRCPWMVPGCDTGRMFPDAGQMLLDGAWM